MGFVKDVIYIASTTTLAFAGWSLVKYGHFSLQVCRRNGRGILSVNETELINRQIPPMISRITRQLQDENNNNNQNNND